MLTERRKTRQVRVGDVTIGGDAPIRVQSMTTTKTADINATLQQIASLVAAGVDIVRVAVPHWEDAEALTAIAAKSTVPVVADIHFQWKYAMAAREARARSVPIRIGVNAGSLEKGVLARHGAPTAGALVESALYEARILEEEDFSDIKISVKHSNAGVMIQAYRLLADACDYPLHLGVTEAGTKLPGAIKSAAALGQLLPYGIGDTIRISLAEDPVEEIPVAYQILSALDLRHRGPNVIACPSCARTLGFDVIGMAAQVEEGLKPF